MKVAPATMTKFPGRLALQQRVIPSYRLPFFDLLAESCEGGLNIFAGLPLAVEGISVSSNFQVVNFTQAKNIHFSDPAAKYYLCWQQGILDWLEDVQPDTLIIEGNPRYLSNRLAIRWMHERGRPVLGWGLGAPAITGIFSVIRHRNRFTYLKSIDGILAYSQRGAREYRAFGIPPEKVFVATNSVMPRPGHSIPKRAEEFDGQPGVLFVGRLQARKRLDILFRACAALPEFIRPRLVIVGDGPARSEFLAMAKSLYPQTEFVGGKYGHEVEEYFQAADLFALPGTGGLAVQQAMAYGLPVIVAKGDGTQDDLVWLKNGWQVQPGDQEAFTNALRQALSDVVRLRQMGAESFRIVSEEANINKMVETFVFALNQISGNKI